MLKNRIIVAVVLMPVLLFVWWFGGIFNAIVMTIVLCLAANEFLNLFAKLGYHPARWITLAGIILLAFNRHFYQLDHEYWMILFSIALLIAWHLIQYESGKEQAPFNLLIDLGAFFYIGWLGSFIILLRDMPDGFWWIMIMLPSTWLADTGAYMIGSLLGKHKMAKLLSPKKSWEGYFGGAVTSILLTPVLVIIYRALGMPETVGISLIQAAIFGLVVSLVTPIGDLFGSMLKRKAGVKDSSNLLPGHGGIFDRIDTWIWAAAIGVFFLDLLKMIAN